MRISVKAWLRILVIKGQESERIFWQLQKLGKPPHELYYLSFMEMPLVPKEQIE